MTRTAEKEGEKTVPIKTTGHEKSSFTLVLACTASGQNFPPMIIFKRKTVPKEKFPPGIIVRGNKKGWMTEDMMKDWINTVYVKRPGGFFAAKKALLVCDSMKAHKTESIKAHLKKKNSLIAVIPGLIKLLQPLDISINKPFKDRLRAMWEHWMVQDDHSFTKTGRQRRASYAQIAEWEVKAWAKITSTAITNGFRKAQLEP